MNKSIKTVILILSVISAWNLMASGTPSMIESKLGPKGEIPYFLVAGPLPAPQEGFGTLVLDQDLEQFAQNPVIGQSMDTPLIASGSTQWALQSIDANGYLDFHPPFTWLRPGSDPEKIWHAHSAFASINLVSKREQDVTLLFGTASQAQVFLNGQEVWQGQALRGAVADEDSLVLSLKQGNNQLIFKVYQSHQNYGLSFFGGSPWQWGIYARLEALPGKTLAGITPLVQGELSENNYNLVSTPFFKWDEAGGLLQKLQISINSIGAIETASLTLGNEFVLELDQLSRGMNYLELWVLSLEKGGKLKTSLSFNGKVIKNQFKLRPQRRWELFYMPFSHQDIGYTHTQPVTAEIQSKNLEDVLDYMNEDPDFKWTVETLWQVEQLFKRQGATRRDEFFKRVSEGRISLSPGWTNSFTGQLSEEEAIRSLEPAILLAAEEGIQYPAFLYNDTPGVSWLWPGLLEELGIKFIFTGINEVYNDYTLQRNLPKLFRWRGGDGGEVLTYLTETYNEGLAHGLEKDSDAMSMLIAGQLARLEDRAWPFSHVGLSVSYLDNGSVPKKQLANIRAWNKEYAWPKFIVATTGDYVQKLESENLDKLPVIQGDWTSAWETRSQGEPARMILQREAQALAPVAEKLSVINWLDGRLDQPDEEAVQDIYNSLLDFSGHGSGLEAGYGNREDNALASSYRGQYASQAWHKSRGLTEREMYRLIVETFSFAGQGVLVFNPSSVRRSEAIQVSFGRMPGKPLHVVDARTGEILPSAWKDNETLVFVAKELVGLGYTKFLLRSGYAAPSSSTDELVWDRASKQIENAYFSLNYAGSNSNSLIQSLYSKTLKRQIIQETNGQHPLSIVSRKPFLGESFTPLTFEDAETEVIDLRPVGIILKIEAPGELAEGLEVGIWAGLSVLDVQATINLEALESPESLEEIGLSLPRVNALTNIRAELAGGWINPAEDLLPGVTPEALSVRQGILLKQKKYSVAVTTRDARVLLLEADPSGKILPVLNLVNNFPKHWNRNEENKGSLTFRLHLEAMQRRAGPMDVGALVSASAEPLIVRDTWLGDNHPEVSSFTLDGDGLLILSMKRSRDGKALVVRIKNADDSGQNKGHFRSAYFDSQTKIYTSNLLEKRGDLLIHSTKGYEISLQPRQILTIRAENLVFLGLGK